MPVNCFIQWECIYSFLSTSVAHVTYLPFLFLVLLLSYLLNLTNCAWHIVSILSCRPMLVPIFLGFTLHIVVLKSLYPQLCGRYEVTYHAPSVCCFVYAVIVNYCFLCHTLGLSLSLWNTLLLLELLQVLKAIKNGYLNQCYGKCDRLELNLLLWWITHSLKWDELKQL